MTSADLKRLAKRIGVDLVGVASIERFRKLPAEADPRSILPEVSSVVVLGFQVPRGALRGIESGTAWHTMSAMSPLHPLIMGEMTYLVVRALEDEGLEATPVFQHPKEMRGQGGLGAKKDLRPARWPSRRVERPRPRQVQTHPKIPPPSLRRRQTLAAPGETLACRAPRVHL